MTRHYIWPALVLLAVALLSPLPAAADESKPPALGLPLVCEIGKTCWIVNYVDHDASAGVSDYTCGKQTYDGHKGTDIAIRDAKVMEQGVPVIASAAGRVLGVRDGERDVDVNTIGRDSVKGKECGNGVLLDHGADWHTQYCHLQRGSIVVKQGDRVEAGQRLGLVGLSGFTEFAHVHIEVRHNKQTVDPFVGIGRQAACGLGPKPLWRAEILGSVAYQQAVLYNVGFATTTPEAKALRDGLYADTVLSKSAPLLAFWVDIFWIQANDEISLRVLDPKGRTVVEQTGRLDKTQARRMFYVGSKRTGVFWDEGVYRGTATIRRESKGGKPEEFSVTRDVTIR